MDKIKLGKRLKAARRESGLTGEHLSGMIGMSRNYIAAIECGKKQPSLDCMARICSILDISADYLMGSEPENGRCGEEARLSAMLRRLPKKDLKLVEEITELLFRSERVH